MNDDFINDTENNGITPNHSAPSNRRGIEILALIRRK